MAGLTNTLSDTQQTTTTMPAWYDQAQQNVVSGGSAAAAAAPTFGQTTQQNAVNTLQGAANPFTQAQGTLQQISSGAANPWITDQATGTVTPNTSTAMGGLFSAQQNELNQLMPNYTAPAQAGAIGSGNFGSLRGQTAVDKARGDAFAKLNAAQMQAALSNQQTGYQAATGLGTVGQEGINANMNVGMQQMNAPFQTIGNQASLLGTLQAPTTVSSQKQLAPLGQISSVGTALQGGLGALNSTAAGASLLKSLGLDKLILGSASSGGALPTGVPTGATLDPSGSGNYILNGQTYNPTGSLLDTSGSVSSGGSNAVNSYIDPNTGNVSTDQNQSGSIFDPNAYGAG